MRLKNSTRVLTVLLGLLAFAASAQEAGPQETEKKPNPLLETEPRSYGSFQLAYQQYYPGDSAQKHALDEIFDQDYFQMVALSFGMYPLRNLGINFNAGFAQPTGHAVGTISGATSDAEITLTVVPLQLEAVYRFDFVDEQFFIPVIGGGGDYWYYDEKTEFGSDSEHVRGNKSGYHALAGAGILLDKLDPSSRGLKEWGIENVFLEIEARMAWINSDDGIDFTGTGYSAGLLFEF